MLEKNERIPDLIVESMLDLFLRTCVLCFPYVHGTWLFCFWIVQFHPYENGPFSPKLYFCHSPRSRRGLIIRHHGIGSVRQSLLVQLLLLGQHATLPVHHRQ